MNTMFSCAINKALNGDVTIVMKRIPTVKS